MSVDLIHFVSTVQFIQNPENQTVVLGQDSVNISCALNVTGRVWRWFQRINNHEVSSSSDTDRLANAKLSF